MTRLRASEKTPVRLIHKPEAQKLPAPLQIVLESLKAGADNAQTISNRTGLPHERVYESLVWLEGNGRARVIASEDNIKRKSVHWGAL